MKKRNRYARKVWANENYVARSNRYSIGLFIFGNKRFGYPGQVPFFGSKRYMKTAYR